MPTFKTRDQVCLKADSSRTGYIYSIGARNETYGVRMHDSDVTEWHDADALELVPVGDPLYNIGEVVRLRTNLAQQGAILASQYLHNGFQYHVFFDPTIRAGIPKRV